MNDSTAHSEGDVEQDVVARPIPADGISPDPTYHWILLVISAVVLFLALILRIQGQQEVLIPGTEIPLPTVCSFRRFFGIDCPGCGLTRCFISMAHGRLQSAWNFNPIGVFLFLLVAAQIPYRGLQLYRIRKGQPEWQMQAVTNTVMCVLTVALLVQWLVKYL